MQLDVIRRISIEAQTKGVDQATAGLYKLSEAQGDVTVASEKQEKSAVSIERALESQRRAIEQSIRSQQQYADIINQQAMASQQLVAANDNVEESFTLLGIEAAEAAGHLRTAAGAAYAFSPAFREVVNGMAKPALGAAASALAAVAAGMVMATNAAGRGLIELGLVAARSSTALAPLGSTIAMAGAAMAEFNPTVGALAGSILTRLLPAIRALTGIGLVINLVQMLGDAWELGGKQLEEYRQIAEKAAAVDLSTTFYQRLIKGAEAAKVPVEELTLLLQNLQKSAADALGGSALEQRLQKHLEAGNFGGNAGVALLGQANTTQQRFEAIVALINKAMQAGQRLAALDLAKTAFGPEVSERLRQDSEYLDKIVEQSKKIAETELVSTADIGRAAELQARYDAAVKLLEQRWHPIQNLLTQLGVQMHTAWVGIVEAIAQAFDNATKLVVKIGEISPNFWDYVRRGANAVASAAAAVAPSVPVVGPALGVGGALLAGATAQEQARATDAYTNALDRLRAGLQNTKGVQQAVNETSTVANRVYGDTSKTLDKVAASAGAQKDQFDRAVEAAEKHISRTRADAQAVGQGAAALEEGRTRAALWTAALQAGIPVVGKVARAIDDLAKRAGEAARELAKARIDQSIKFQKDTIGLSNEDVQIAQQLAAIYPKVADALSSVEAQQMRVANAQRMLADGFRDVGKEIFSAFVQGKDVMDAMVRSLDALASKLANAAFENILSGLMTGNLAQAGIGALQAGASALISAFTSDQKASKEVEEARKRWKDMADQLHAFNRAAAGFDTGPLTSELEELRRVHDTLALAALQARDYAALNQIHETLNRGIRRVFGEWMNGIPVLGDLSQKIQDLRNEAQGLKDVIPEAAAAIDQGLIARIRQVTEEAERSLQADINSARGLDWLNEAGEAIDKFNDLAGKVDPSLLNTWFVVNAQKIIDGSQLTGEAFQTLVDTLAQAVPGIAESLHEFSEAIQRTAADIAKAKQSFSDQLFVLQQDQNTLAGSLAVFDLQAQRQREEEIKAGGQALAELEALQAQQRYNIIKDFNDKAIADQQRAADAQKRALEEAQQAFNGFVRNIKDFIANYLSGSESGLSPAARLANAQGAFSTQLALAQGGDRDALNSITQYFQDLIAANRGFNASSPAGAAIEANALASLQALPGQISPEQFIVDAINATSATQVSAIDAVNASLLGQVSTAIIQGSAQNFATAILPHFNSLLDPNNGLLKQAQLETKLNLPNGSLDKIFKELDGNGNGILEKSELIRVATQGTQTGVTDVDTNTESLPQQATKIAGMETSLLALAQVSNNTQSTANLLSVVNSQLTGSGGSIAAISQAMRLMMREQNQAWGLQVYTPLPQFAMGTNFAPGGIALVGERGPEIVDLPRGSRVIPNHVAFSANDNSELLAEIRRLNAKVERLTAVSAAGHEGAIEAAQEGNSIARKAADARRLQRTRAA